MSAPLPGPPRAAALPLPSRPEGVEARMPAHLYALKDRDMFVIGDAFGDIYGDSDGLFHNDTRMLSELRLTLGGAQPSLLSAAISRDNVFFVSHLTNRPLPPLGGRSVRQGVIHVERARFLCDEHLYERIDLFNYGPFEAILPVALHFGADFRDMFEVRGQARSSRGMLLPTEVGIDRVVYRYQGLDRRLRYTVSVFVRAESPAAGPRGFQRRAAGGDPARAPRLHRRGG